MGDKDITESSYREDSTEGEGRLMQVVADAVARIEAAHKGLDHQIRYSVRTHIAEAMQEERKELVQSLSQVQRASRGGGSCVLFSIVLVGLAFFGGYYAAQHGWLRELSVVSTIYHHSRSDS